MATHLASIYRKLKDYPQYLECITSINYLPEECVDTSKLVLEDAGGIRLNVVTEFTGQIKRTVMDVPKYDKYPDVEESKLLMYPYSYAEITAYTGETLDLKLEYIEGNNITVESWGYMQPDTRLAFLIKGYNKDTSLDNALIVRDYPQLPTASSGYLMYLAQSKMQTALSLGLGGLSIAGGLMTGNLLATGYGVQSVAQTLAKQSDIQAQPNSIHTQKGGNGFNIANNIKGFSVKKKMIKSEYREILTNYWKAYGYKVNKIKKPNLHTRQSFNYVKTVGANITGDIPNDDMDKLKEIFNQGVTLWHIDNVGDYSVSNNEV